MLHAHGGLGESSTASSPVQPSHEESGAVQWGRGSRQACVAGDGPITTNQTTTYLAPCHLKLLDARQVQVEDHMLVYGTTCPFYGRDGEDVVQRQLEESQDPEFLLHCTKVGRDELPSQRERVRLFVPVGRAAPRSNRRGLFPSFPPVPLVPRPVTLHLQYKSNTMYKTCSWRRRVILGECERGATLDGLS